MSNFNYIASFYDPFARLVFGNNMVLAKKQFIERIKPGSNILIFGGGTGDILNDIFLVIPNVTIDFIEPSAVMIKIAKKKLQQQYRHRVNFIQGNQSCIKPGMHYDVVALFFVLDMFIQREALDLSVKINAAVKNGGIWLFADFFNTRIFFQKLLTRVMYLFFKVTTGISANRLPEFDLIFKQIQLTLIDEKLFLQGWIRTRVYLK